MLASYGGNANCVKVLLNYRADITKRNSRGETALEECAEVN
jgi:ankyrin repeat protein